LLMQIYSHNLPKKNQKRHIEEMIYRRQKDVCPGSIGYVNHGDLYYIGLLPKKTDIYVLRKLPFF
jgi:hypothetical protein